MGVSVTGIIINIIILLIIIALIIAGFIYENDLKTCENAQSPFCYTIICPCDDVSSGPCGQYAKRPGPTTDTWYCSNSPLTLVNSDGSPV